MITRVTADEYIAFVRKQARKINAGRYAFTVVRIEVFGSYLTNKDPLGDLDLLVTIAPRFADQARQRDAENDRREGRAFRNVIENVYWPREEVHRALKERKRGISIHDANERDALIADYGVVFTCVYEQEDL